MLLLFRETSSAENSLAEKGKRILNIVVAEEETSSTPFPDVNIPLNRRANTWLSITDIVPLCSSL